MKEMIKEVIIVEGRYDKNAVRQVVDATVIETSGFSVFSDFSTGSGFSLRNRARRVDNWFVPCMFIASFISFFVITG